MLSTPRQYQRIAPFYDLLELPFEHGRYRRLRRLVFDGLSGRILEELQRPALQELGRVARAGGTVRLLDYVRPLRPLRRALASLWEPWMAWAYGASFDRRTAEYVPKAGLELVKAEFVVDELVKLLTVRVPEELEPMPRAH